MSYLMLLNKEMEERPIIGFHPAYIAIHQTQLPPIQQGGGGCWYEFSTCFLVLKT